MTDRDNRTLTEVSAGTPMGDLMRRYWIPAALSTELLADKPPVRLMLLGEKLIAFRDSSGRLGVFDHSCPHRCASLFLGRNEENGLRCVYHGWKFDVTGALMEMPNAPRERNANIAVKAKAYPVQERSGLVWVFLGDVMDVPPLPDIEASMLDGEDIDIEFIQRECNWLQSLEGDIDTSHYDFLHMGLKQGDDFAPDDPRRYGVMHRDPEIIVEKTEWGMMYGAFRPADEGRLYWRIAHFMFPFYTLTPNRPFDKHVSVRAWVPMDDTHTMAIRIARKQARSPEAHARLKPNSSGWYGRFQSVINADNDWQIDRDMQRHSNFTGIVGVHHQDQAVTESMGPITARSKENMVSSDMPIAVTRNILLRAAEGLADKGKIPPAADDPRCYFKARSGYFLAKEKTNWLDAYGEQLKNARRFVSEPGS
jgi:phthalate 4,5-dioxygenase oxygenase subunit